MEDSKRVYQVFERLNKEGMKVREDLNILTDA